MTSTTIAPSTHLTKKQKKALAFRQKSKSHSSKSSTKTAEEYELDQDVATENVHVPALEDKNLVSSGRGQVEIGGLDGKNREGKKKAGVEVMVELDRDQGKKWQKRERGKEGKTKGAKRKRELDEAMDIIKEGNGRKEKKRRTTTKAEDETGKWEGKQVEDESENEDESGGQGEQEGEAVSKDGKRKSKEKQRFILFIGNLKYTTTAETIKDHFSACEPLPTVRLLTPKTSSTGKTTVKSKGCAFLEFENRSALQEALKLHHSLLEGRIINVELTAGGGGKSEKRLAKLRERNKALLGQKKRRTVGQDVKLDKTQRYSATSGIEQPSTTKRTWSVGDAAEDKARRGGKKHQRIVKSRKPMQKEWATGVNAIPVG